MHQYDGFRRNKNRIENSDFLSMPLLVFSTNNPNRLRLIFNQNSKLLKHPIPLFHPYKKTLKPKFMYLGVGQVDSWLKKRSLTKSYVIFCNNKVSTKQLQLRAQNKNQTSQKLLVENTNIGIRAFNRDRMKPASSDASELKTLQSVTKETFFELQVYVWKNHQHQQ